jgi:DHA1 family inner membrane transport protein
MTSVALEQPTAPAVRARYFVLAVLALAMGGFAIGTTEFVTMGLLPEIADGVGVSIPTAGHMISAYAVGVVVGAPVLAYFGAGTRAAACCSCWWRGSGSATR